MEKKTRNQLVSLLVRPPHRAIQYNKSSSLIFKNVRLDLIVHTEATHLSACHALSTCCVWITHSTDDAPHMDVRDLSYSFYSLPRDRRYVIMLVRSARNKYTHAQFNKRQTQNKNNTAMLPIPIYLLYHLSIYLSLHIYQYTDINLRAESCRQAGRQAGYRNELRYNIRAWIMSDQKNVFHSILVSFRDACLSGTKITKGGGETKQDDSWYLSGATYHMRNKNESWIIR